MKRLFSAALTAVLFSGILSAVEARIADADGDGINDRRARQHRLNLTDEQRAEIRETKRGLREQGATRVEIVTAMGEKLQSLGVELPEDFEERHAAKLERAVKRDELRAMVTELKESGATREEIRAEVDAFREANGIEKPKRGRHSRGRAFRGKP